MTNFVVSVGGTGAKCTEALLHLAGAGVLGETDIHVIPVDQDQNNGNLSRMRDVAASLTSLRRALTATGQNNGSRSAFSADISFSPTFKPADDAEATLRKIFALGPEEPAANTADRMLAHALYNRSERTRRMDNGFDATPPLGAAVFSRWAGGPGSPLVQHIRERLTRHVDGAPLRIVITGSLFGGTGASGVPTLARVIREATADLRPQVCAVLMTPYFHVAGRDHFGPRTAAQAAAALTYYRDQMAANVPLFDRLYLLGWNPTIAVAADGEQGGGRNQANPALIPELYAGLAISDFLTDPSRAPGHGLRMISRTERESLGWEDLPAPPSLKGKLSDALRSMAAAAYAYHYALRPALKEHALQSDILARLPFYAKYLDTSTAGLLAMGEAMEALDKYCPSFLAWAGSLQACHPLGMSWRLFTPGTPEFLDLSAESGWSVAGIKPLAQGSDAEVQWVKRTFTSLIGNGEKGLPEVLCEMSRRPPPKCGPGLAAFFEGMRQSLIPLLRPFAA